MNGPGPMLLRLIMTITSSAALTNRTNQRGKEAIHDQRRRYPAQRRDYYEIDGAWSVLRDLSRMLAETQAKAPEAEMSRSHRRREGRQMGLQSLPLDRRAPLRPTSFRLRQEEWYRLFACKCRVHLQAGRRHSVFEGLQNRGQAVSAISLGWFGLGQGQTKGAQNSFSLA